MVVRCFGSCGGVECWDCSVSVGIHDVPLVAADGIIREAGPVDPKSERRGVVVKGRVVL